MSDQTVGPYTRSTSVDDDARVHVGTTYTRRKGVAEWVSAVWLPHDCEEWMIAKGEPEHVIEQVQLLIESLQEALTVLSSETTTPVSRIVT